VPVASLCSANTSRRIYQGEPKVHAEPIAALDALKPTSLAVTRGTSMYLALRAVIQSTQSPRFGQIAFKKAARGRT
jgi:hypothetical protein